MPLEQMDAKQVAHYLHADVREVIKLASRGQIPCRKVGGMFVFLKGQVDHWVEDQMHELGGRRLAGIEKGVSAHHGFEHSDLIGPMIPRDPGGIAVPLKAKTRDSTVRALVELAELSDLVYNRDELTSEIFRREDLCSTALFPAVALPHPRHPLPYDIAESFIVVGLAAGGGIPFGSSRGDMTRLFFLVCCKDERTHLHVLARLARMLDDKAGLAEMLAAASTEQLRGLLAAREAAVLAQGH